MSTCNKDDVHAEHLRAAITLAVDGVHANKGGPFGAMVVDRDGRVISRAYNEVTSAADPTAHAEILAIRRACIQRQSHLLEGCSLYTSCWPCPMCAGAVQWSHIEHVYYAATPHDALTVGFDDKVFTYYQRI